MRRFILSNRPGSDLHIAVENPSPMHSIIRVIKSDGTEDEPIPWTPLTNHMYPLQPDPQYRKPQYIITPTGEKEIPLMHEEDTLYIGENPFIQLIYYYVKQQPNGAKKGDIIRFLTQEKRVISNVRLAERYIDEMHNGSLSGLLYQHAGKYYCGVKLKTKKQPIKIRRGYDPVEDQILKLAESKTAITREEIHKHLLTNLKWIHSPKTVERYIKQLVKKKCLTPIEKDWFQYNKHPETI